LLNLRNLKKIACDNSLLSKTDLQILVKNNINMEIICQYSITKINLPPFYYSIETKDLEIYDELGFNLFNINL